MYGLHFIAATPACSLAESFGLGENGGSIMDAMTPRFEKGQLYVSKKPGFGVEIDESSLARLRRY